MRNSTKFILLALAVGEAVLAVVLYHLLSGVSSPVAKYLVLLAVIGLSLGIDALIIRGSSAESVSDAKRLKDTDDYIKAFQAWLWEETPFAEQIKIALRQLESLKRKQAALRAILDDTKDSPFLSVANDVNAYILANCRKVLNRVMIYDSAEPHKYSMHAAYLQEVLGENAHMLSDFENLILEVSQIGDDTAAATPCLTELTNALRQVRSGEDLPSQPGSSTEAPRNQMMQQ